MLHELDQPAFVEVIEKASDVSVQNVVHFLLQERVRQRIQRLMLAAPRAKTIRDAENVFLVDLLEDGDHGMLDQFVLDSRDREWALPPIFILYVHSSRGHRSIRSAMNPALEISQPIFQDRKSTRLNSSHT